MTVQNLDHLPTFKLEYIRLHTFSPCSTSETSSPLSRPGSRVRNAKLFVHEFLDVLDLVIEDVDRADVL